MIVPSQVQFSTIPVGGVFSPDAVIYYMKTDVAAAVNLFTGAEVSSVPPTQLNTYFPDASLSLG